MFVTSDAQLLRFPASAVRPQGRAAGGMAGINLGADARVVFFTSVPAASATRSWSPPIATGGDTLLGADPGSGKVSAVRRVPRQGPRHRRRARAALPQGRDRARARLGRPRTRSAVGPDGAARTLPEAGAKRDASGTPLDVVVGSIGRRLGA